MTGKGPLVRRVAGFRVALAVLLLLCGPVSVSGQETSPPDPCAGTDAFLAVLDRPTASDSACAVPPGRVVLETGFQRASVRGAGGGDTLTYPQAVVRLGLPGRNEFVLLAPNYNRQEVSSPPSRISGLSAVTLGFKHEVGYNKAWLGAVEALVTLPSGGSAFGSKGTGIAANGIVSYAPVDDVGLALQLGLNSQTMPSSSGGGRFTSFVANFVAAWEPVERLQFYGEVFGQTKTAPGEGAGYNADGGIQYLITPSIEADIEAGVRLFGDLGGYTHYFGAGIGFLF